MTKKKTRAWNKRFNQLKMACWNPWGLSNERMNYCKEMQFDILGLTELHNGQNKSIWRSKRWITCEDSEVDAQGKSSDPAAGVGILLSKNFASKILSKGSVGSRIVWVRLDGPVCPLFVVCTYIPHKYKKTSPTAEDTITQLENLLTNCEHIKPMDCTIIMGDLNCELQRNMCGCTGQWCMNTRPDDGHGSRVLTFMRSHDLFAVDSMFRPTRRYMFDQETKKRVCNATYLQKDGQLRPKKLDYFLVSNRWKSCVLDSKTNWVPSIHRFGKAFDHGLLSIKWKWRVKTDKSLVAKDFKSMQNEDWHRFDEKLSEKLQSSSVQAEKNENEITTKCIDAQLKRMNNCIRSTIQECVANKKRLNDIKREISDRTRNLYEQRAAKFSKITAQGGTVSKQLRKRWNRRIKEANLADYNTWLKSMAAEMEAADRKGDSATVFRIVKVVSGLMTAASGKAPSVDKDG